MTSGAPPLSSARDLAASWPFIILTSPRWQVPPPFPELPSLAVRALAAVTAVTVLEGFTITQPADAVTSCGSMSGECRSLPRGPAARLDGPAALGCLVSEPGPAAAAASQVPGLPATTQSPLPADRWRLVGNTPGTSSD
jgi:hypothetical protein